ncbi:TPA: hypothetical protein ACGO1F_000391 [Streptococcus suis]
MSIAATVALPVVVVGGGVYAVANQRKLKKEIQYLFILIADLKEQLKEDSRENVSKLLAVIDQLILDIEKKHKV